MARYVDQPEQAETEVTLSSEMGPIITALKGGNIMTRYYCKRAPEMRVFSLQLEEFQIAWSRTGGGKEGARVEGCGKKADVIANPM